MKKSIFAVLILLGIILFLPTLGNTFIKQEIDTRVSELQSFGLEVSQDKTVSTYLHTSRHFEFLLKDSQKFLTYLQQYSAKQIPPYVNAMFEGVIIGADIEYSNLPFAKAFEVEIYPMTLSEKMSEELQKSDLDIYKKLTNFLSLKGLLYHIEYNLLNEDFKGYIKDIKEEFLLKDGTELRILLEDVDFKGNGVLIAPKELSSKMKNLHFSVHQNEKSLEVVLKNLKSGMNFESLNTYVTSVEIDTMQITLSGVSDDINISMDELRVNGSSNDQTTTVQLNSKTSLKSLQFTTKDSNFMMQKFNFDMALNELDKDEYLHLTQLLSQDKVMVSQQYSEAIQTSAIKLLSKGLVLNIADFSVGKFAKGFKINTLLTIKEDKDLLEKMKISPLMAITNINFQSDIRISKELYAKLQKTNPMLARLNGYEKEDGDDHLFILRFSDGKASINGRSLN